MAQKFALIIGNSKHDDRSLAGLKAPGADARTLAEMLRAPNIGGFDLVTTLTDEPGAVVRRAIAQFFAGKVRDDLLLLYFSGHGVLDENGQLYLAVKDTERELLTGTAIEASYVTNQMDRSTSRRQVLILDCCHSGAFARGKGVMTGATVGMATAFEGIGTGRVVLTASDSTQYAFEGDRVTGQAENSLFTHYLMEGIRTGAADKDGDGQITVEEMYDYAYARVVSETPNQKPGKWSYKEQGEIVIARNPRPKPAELPQWLQQLIGDAKAEVRVTGMHKLGALMQDPDERVVLAAREALTRLADDDSRMVSNAAAEILRQYQVLPQVKVGEPPIRRRVTPQPTVGASALPREQTRPIEAPKTPKRRLSVWQWILIVAVVLGVCFWLFQRSQPTCVWDPYVGYVCY